MSKVTGELISIVALSVMIAMVVTRADIDPMRPVIAIILGLQVLKCILRILGDEK